MDPIVAALKARREQLGITTSELSRRLGLVRNAIAERERRSNSPTVWTLCTWADALGLELRLVVSATGQARYPCGTVAAAKRHYYRGEPLCRPCRTAQRTYDRERKSARRPQSVDKSCVEDCGEPNLDRTQGSLAA